MTVSVPNARFYRLQESVQIQKVSTGNRGTAGLVSERVQKPDHVRFLNSQDGGDSTECHVLVCPACIESGRSVPDDLVGAGEGSTQTMSKAKQKEMCEVEVEVDVPVSVLKDAIEEYEVVQEMDETEDVHFEDYLHERVDVTYDWKLVTDE